MVCFSIPSLKMFKSSVKELVTMLDVFSTVDEAEDVSEKGTGPLALSLSLPSLALSLSLTLPVS
jgi:hypothetical protein